MATEKAAKRQHRATYSQDKRNGGYLVRVVGPNAGAFAGREVPVEVKGGEEHPEKLTRLIATGIDDGKYNPVDKGKPWALYRFEAKPREEKKVDF